MVGDEEDLVLDCYRLARWYHQSPEVFLNMPLDEVRVHLMRTHRVRNLQRAAERAEAEGDDG
jgi:hypothetical protein